MQSLQSVRNIEGLFGWDAAEMAGKAIKKCFRCFTETATIFMHNS
jgi:hypothetical protein